MSPSIHDWPFGMSMRNETTKQRDQTNSNVQCICKKQQQTVTVS